VVPFESLGAVSYSHSIANGTTLSRVISKIKRFVHTPAGFDAPVSGVPVGIW